MSYFSVASNFSDTSKNPPAGVTHSDAAFGPGAGDDPGTLPRSRFGLATGRSVLDSDLRSAPLDTLAKALDELRNPAAFLSGAPRWAGDAHLCGLMGDDIRDELLRRVAVNPDETFLAIMRTGRTDLFRPTVAEAAATIPITTESEIEAQQYWDAWRLDFCRYAGMWW